MRRTGVFLVLAVAAVVTAKGAASSVKANRLEDRYASNYIAVWNLLDQLQPLTGNVTFLSNLSKLAHQTTTNSSIVNGNGNLSGADATAINGVITAVNNLQSGLQSHNFEA